MGRPHVLISTYVSYVLLCTIHINVHVCNMYLGQKIDVDTLVAFFVIIIIHQKDLKLEWFSGKGQVLLEFFIFLSLLKYQITKAFFSSPVCKCVFPTVMWISKYLPSFSRNFSE